MFNVLRSPTRDVITNVVIVCLVSLFGLGGLWSDDVWLLRHGREVQVRVVEKVDSDFRVVAGDAQFVANFSNNENVKVGDQRRLLVDPNDLHRNVERDDAVFLAIFAMLALTSPITVPLVWWLHLRYGRRSRPSKGGRSRMRNYLYLWNDPGRRALVASGLEFADLIPTLAANGGVVMIRHRSEQFHSEPGGFAFVGPDDLAALAAEHIYSWGDFVWVDVGTPEPPEISDDAAAKLLFFAHTGRPLRAVDVPGLHNRFLAHTADDGWYLRLHYTDWGDIASLLASFAPDLNATQLSELERGVRAFWISDGQVSQEEMTHDVDSVMNRRITSESNGAQAGS